MDNEIKKYCESCKFYSNLGCQSTLICHEGNRFIAADVQPVIHAKWVLFDKDCVGRAFYCSNCRKVTTTDDYEDTPLDREEYFCMRCGADMREPKPIKG